MKDRTERKSRRIYYSMGEVAEMFDVNPSLIRYWESRFDILKPDKNKKGNRLFTPTDVDNLKLIYYLVKEKGMTLDGAQKRIKENKEGLNHDLEIIDRLQSIRAMLVEIREELKMTEDDIAIGIDDAEIEAELARAEQDERNARRREEKRKEQLASLIDEEDDDISFELHIGDEFDPAKKREGIEVAQSEKAKEIDLKLELDLAVEQEDAECIEPLPPLESLPEEVFAQAVNEIVAVESPIEQDYIAELSRELSEEAETASEVMETLARLKKEDEEEKPAAYEQRLF